MALAGSIGLWLACIADPASARADDLHKMTYEVYAGGINAVTAELDILTTPKERYSLNLSAFTKGFLGTLVPWTGRFESHGWVKKDTEDRPELHRSTATWRNEDEIKEYRYDRTGKFVSYSVIDPENDGIRPVDDALVQGTTDILTATYQVMKSVANGGQCEGVSEIFDGKRRYKLAFRYEADEMLTKSRYNVYEGPSQRCVAEVLPGEGQWHSKPRGWLSIQEQGRQKGSLPTIWFAQVDDNGPAVPVKIRIKTEYGGMFMHLVNYENQGEIRRAAVMGKN